MANSHPVEAIIGPVAPFLDVVLAGVKEKGINISGKEIDHVCFRCTTISEYQAICKRIVDDGFGEMLIESMIGGRPIATIKLFNPLVYQDYRILCLEIPCPKPGKSHSAGLEHCEIVIGESSQSPLDSRPLLEAFMAQYPTITDFNTKAVDKHVNADVCLDIAGGYSVKFHLRPLYEVISFEMAQGLVEPVPAGYFE
jgi:uncharacterized protein